MRRTPFVACAVCLIVLVACSALVAQQPPAAPKPGPEVNRLAYFAGQWKVEGEAKASAFGPAGKFSETSKCEFFAGGFQVVCNGDGTGPTGRITELGIMAYDPEAKDYTYYGIDSMGESVLAHGKLAGDTWTYTWTGTISGKPAAVKVTMATTKTSYSSKAEGSIGGGPMTVISEGKATRIGS